MTLSYADSVRVITLLGGAAFFKVITNPACPFEVVADILNQPHFRGADSREIVSTGAPFTVIGSVKLEYY